MKKDTLILCAVTAACCVLMAFIDGVVQPAYAVKSAIKIGVFLLIPLVCARVLDLSVWEALRPDKKALLTGAVLGISAFGVILGAYAGLHRYLDLSAVPAALAQTGVTKENFLYVNTYIALCNSFLEEFFFRCFVFLGLAKRTGTAFAYLVSALAFALYHAGMLISMVALPLFLLALIALVGCGLLFNFLSHRRKRIWASWLLHMGANFAINLVGMHLLGMI